MRSVLIALVAIGSIAGAQEPEEPVLTAEEQADVAEAFLQQVIADRKLQLAEARLRYTDQHPYVQSRVAQIETLEAQLAQLLATKSESDRATSVAD